MNQSDLDELDKLLSKSSKVFICRDSNGRKKIKIKTGFLGLGTKRFVVDAPTMEMLRVKHELNRDQI
jgi:hypothetical protein